MTYESFDILMTHMNPLLINPNETGRPTINPQTQMLATLWLLATPDSFRSVGDRFNLSKSSMYECFRRVIKGLNKLAKTIIKWPEISEIPSVCNGFSKTGIFGIIGAIDGCYIQIKGPKENKMDYRCRHKYYAITLQAICDHTLTFRDCFVGYPSSVHDRRIFKNSDVFKHITEDQNLYFPNEEFIIGDKAYPVKEWCIPPYIDNGILSATEKNFNVKLSKVRCVIENAFALLKGRFRRLFYLNMNVIEAVPYVIMACCVLHNVCLSSEEELTLYVNNSQSNQHASANDSSSSDEDDDNINVFADGHDDLVGLQKRDTMATKLMRFGHT